MRTLIRAVLTTGLAVGPAILGAQEEPDRAAVGAPRVALGIMGFSAKGGVDFENEGQAVVAVAVDLGYLLTPRLRLRPSGELGFLRDDNTYVGNVELVYRLRPEVEATVPYVGTGLGLFGRAECGTDPGCPAVWLQFVLGFEVRIRPGVRWLLEYHPENSFGRQRVFLGFASEGSW
jgi:hypothetical protein